MGRFVKYRQGKVLSWGIVDEDTGRVHNHMGGWSCTIEELRDENLIDQSVEAENFEDLDWAGTWLTTGDSTPCGWVDPDGHYFPCRSQDHIDYAKLVLHSSERELESAGWAKIASDLEKPDVYVVMVDRRLSPDQRNTILMLGIPLEDDE